MKLKISIPWYFAQFGGRAWLRDRALHAPEAWLPTLCKATGLTPEQWRKVEATLVALLYDGIEKI